MYTDGVTEAQNSKDELFFDARLIDAFNTNDYSKLKADEILRDIDKKISEFVDVAEQSDDITMLLFRV